MKVFYFGCENDCGGHYLWDKGHNRSGLTNQSTRTLPECPWSAGEIDAQLASFFSLVHPVVPYQQEGACAIHHKSGYTALAFWDRSVDKRMGRNSCFMAEGYHEFDQMVELFKQHFPKVVARIAFPLVLV